MAFFLISLVNHFENIIAANADRLAVEHDCFSGNQLLLILCTHCASARTVRATGVLLWDVDTGRAWELAAFSLNGQRRLVVAEQAGAQLYQSAGRAGRSFTGVTTFTATATSTAASFTFGLNANLPIRPGRTVRLPRTARRHGHVLLIGDPPQFGPATASYSFSPSRSQSANAKARTLEQAVDEWRAIYAARGYVE